MVLFLGYDPGGFQKHGVAAAEIGPNGKFQSDPITETLATAADVQNWLDGQEPVGAIGIDTLMAWSTTGNRTCDAALRRFYPHRANSVISQNSLYSAMTVNGIIVANHARSGHIPVVESHPKLLIQILDQADSEGNAIISQYNHLIEKGARDKKSKAADDMADALVAAWCASRWFFKRWSTNLFDDFQSDLHFPAGETAYPWPESIQP